MGSKTRGYDPLFRLKVKCFLIINKSPFLTSTLTIFPVAVFNAPCIPPNSRVRFFNGYFSPEVVIPLALGNANNYEDRILELQSKLRFMIAQSPELRNSPEGTDALNQKINGILGGIEDTRLRAGQGAIERQVINPDEAFLLFNKLKGGSQNE